MAGDACTHWQGAGVRAWGSEHGECAVHDGALSGVVDWEFAGRGWREQDLAWVLRARTAFLNTPAERDALLQGYREHASYDEEALRWCEVLNYLHFAYWSREDEPEYTAYALHKARERADL